MKIPSLPSRRKFLITLGAATGAIVLRPMCLRAADKPRSALDFIIISDTHLGKGDSLAPERLWLKTATEVNAAPGAFVLHLGDIVDSAREEQYAPYLEARKLIKKPVHEIPGNHDEPEHFKKHIRQDVDTAFDHEWLRVVLMNNSHRDSHDGFFTAEQLAWLARSCDEAAERGLCLLVCTHVPVHSNTHPDRAWYVKPANGQTEFYAIMKKHESRVLGVFHGHYHNGIRGWDDRAPLHEVIFPSALYNQDRKLEAQKAAGYNLPEFRPGYTLVRLREGAMILEYKVTGAESDAHKTLRLGRS